MAAALVVLMVDCCNQHDTDALAACYAPDTWVHPAGWPQVVDARTRLATFGVILATFPDLRLHPRNLLPTAGWRSASDWYSALRRWKRKVRVSALRSRQTGSTIPKTALGRQHHWARGIQDKPSMLNGEGVDEGRTRVSR